MSKEEKFALGTIIGFLVFLGLVAFPTPIFGQERDKPSFKADFDLASSITETSDNHTSSDVKFNTRGFDTVTLKFRFGTGLTKFLSAEGKFGFGVLAFNNYPTSDLPNAVVNGHYYGGVLDLEAVAVYKRLPELKIKAGLAHFRYKTDLSDTLFESKNTTSLTGPVVGVAGEHTFKEIILGGGAEIYPFLIRRDGYFWIPQNYRRNVSSTAMGLGFNGTIGWEVDENVSVRVIYTIRNYLMSNTNPFGTMTPKHIPGSTKVSGLDVNFTYGLK